MPKDKRVQSLSLDRSRASPYPCSSSSRDSKQYKTEIPSGSLENAREWDDVRCPICLEHPHNAVLLQCSSSEKGCRPYMCNTSYRHSNCLDQFLKTSVPTLSTEMPQEIPPRCLNPALIGNEASRHVQSRHDVKLLQQKLTCPLCRGEIFGYSVEEAARRVMNLKVRSCSSENCDFSGTYSELRKHARSDHPSVRPMEVDPERQHDWRRLENIRGFTDVLSLMQPMIGEDNSEDFLSYASYDTFLYLLLGSYLICEVEELLVSRDRHQVSDIRSSQRPLRFRHNMEVSNAARHRLINNIRSGRTHIGRDNVETNLSPGWIDHMRVGRVNHGRYNVESNHGRYNMERNRWNDNQRSQRLNSNPSQGLRWRGQQRSRFNNQR